MATYHASLLLLIFASLPLGVWPLPKYPIPFGCYMKEGLMLVN